MPIALSYLPGLFNLLPGLGLPQDGGHGGLELPTVEGSAASSTFDDVLLAESAQRQGARALHQLPALAPASPESSAADFGRTPPVEFSRAQSGKTLPPGAAERVLDPAPAVAARDIEAAPERGEFVTEPPLLDAAARDHDHAADVNGEFNAGSDRQATVPVNGSIASGPRAPEVRVAAEQQPAALSASTESTSGAVPATPLTRQPNGAEGAPLTGSMGTEVAVTVRGSKAVAPAPAPVEPVVLERQQPEAVQSRQGAEFPSQTPADRLRRAAASVPHGDYQQMSTRTVAEAAPQPASAARLYAQAAAMVDSPPSQVDSRGAMATPDKLALAEKLGPVASDAGPRDELLMKADAAKRLKPPSPLAPMTSPELAERSRGGTVPTTSEAALPLAARPALLGITEVQLSEQSSPGRSQTPVREHGQSAGSAGTVPVPQQLERRVEPYRAVAASLTLEAAPPAEMVITPAPPRSLPATLTGLAPTRQASAQHLQAPSDRTLSAAAAVETPRNEYLNQLSREPLLASAKTTEEPALPSTMTMPTRQEVEVAPIPPRAAGDRFPAVAAPATAGNTPAEFSELIQQQFLQALRQRAAKLDRITLQLHPRHLGTLELEFRHDGNEVAVQVQAREAHTRDLFDQAAPRLRQQLAELGVNLTSVTVQDEASHQQRQRRDGAAAMPPAQDAPDEELASPRREPRPRDGVTHDYYV